MEIMTFEAYSMKEAVKSVKKSLGGDAVIIGTKEKPAPTGKGLIYEVTATAASAKKGKTSGSSALEVRHLEQMIEGISLRLAAMQDIVAGRQQVSIIEGGVSELKLLLLENLRQRDGSILRDVPDAMLSLIRQLVVMGVDEAYLADLVRHLRGIELKSEKERSAADVYRDEAIRWVMRKIKVLPKWNLAGAAPSVQAFIGVAGVGKSGLVAKVAAHYHTRDKSKVAVISTDASRLAAGDQLRVICKVLGVPFAMVSDPAELQPVMQGFPGIELLLIDTPGLGCKEKDGLRELAALREVCPAIDFHLCLSLTEREEQLDASIRQFSSLGLSSLAFTKVDESLVFGSLLNLCRRWGLPLSFFSVGRDIPGDLERSTRERVVERVFGL